MKAAGRFRLREGSALLILGIDTSGKTASCALCDEDKVLAQSTVYTTFTQSQVILPICKRVLDDAGVSLSEIGGIAVAKGPGSYTGLRIGIAAVKGMALSLGVPCAGISTLEALAYNMAGFCGTVVPVMRARQNLVYTALFTSDGENVTRLSDDCIISEEELDSLISDKGSVILVGDAAAELHIKDGLPALNKALLAPPHVRLQLASSLCMAAVKNGFSTPKELEAAYLQPTKAEKDRTK